VGIVALGGVVVAALLFRKLLLPVFVAAALAYLFHPLIAWAEGFAIKRHLAVAALYAGLAVLLVASWLLVGGRIRAEAAAFAAGLPRLAERVEQGLAAGSRELAEMYPALERFLPRVGGEEPGWIDRTIASRVAHLEDLAHQAGTIFIFVVLVPVFTFFLLRDSERMIGFAMDQIPPAHIETSVAVWCEIDRIIGRYLRGVALDGFVVGVIAAAGLWMLGVPYAIWLGAFAGLANAVPFLGPLLGASAASLVMLVHTQTLAGVGGVILLFIGVKLVDDAVIQPLTIGRSLHLHPTLLLASVVAGNQALGVLGMILAVPAATVLQEVGRLLIEHRHTLAAHQASLAPPPSPRVVC
jgi:predicted PurR-regulated permease PerM